MKIKKIIYNWRQIGSVNDRDGAGEDWNRYTLGEKGVVSIYENFDEAIPNYSVVFEDGCMVKIFNPNKVEFVK